MSDNNENISIAASGSGKSPEEVAFELVSKLKGQGVWGERNIEDILDMYAKCLDAAKGLRAYEGQSRIDTPIKTAQTVAPAPPQTQAQTQTPQVQPQAVPVQTVHAQQQ